jgi:hypothetical protein
MDFKETIKVLKRAHRAKKTVLLRGNHGIGKSAVVHMFYRMLCEVHGVDKVGFEDIRLSEMDVGDLRGIPFRVLGQTYFAPPNWYPVHPADAKRIDSWLGAAGEEFKPLQAKPYGVLLLDEFNRSTLEVRQTSFELSNDRRMGGIHIPDGWLLVAAINGDRDLYDVSDLDAALLNRFVVIDFNPSPEDWYKFAEHRVNDLVMHPSVLAYLRAHGEKMDPSREDIIAAAKTGEPLYTRRSWTNLGEFLAATDGEDDLTDFTTPEGERFLQETAQGFLGANVSRAFVNYIKSDYRTLNPKDVLDHWGPQGEDYVRKLWTSGRVHELTGGLCSGVLAELKRREKVLPTNVVQNIIGFSTMLPGEVISGFYTAWCKQDRAQSDYVYDYVETDPETGKPLLNDKGKPVCPFKLLVFRALSKSEALKKSAVTA